MKTWRGEANTFRVDVTIVWKEQGGNLKEILNVCLMFVVNQIAV